MSTYIFLTCFPIFSSFFFKNLRDDKEKRKKFLIICGAVLLFFTAFRSRYLGSTDTYNYYNYYRVVSNMGWSDFIASNHPFEWGFRVFNFILSRVFKDPQWIIIFSSIIIITCALYSIYKNSKDVAFSVAMYVSLGLWQFQVQGMRQAIAMSILMVAYEFLKDKKYYKFILLVALATTFHVTALVFLVVLLGPFLKSMLSVITTSFVFGVILFVFMDDLIRFVNTVLDSDYGAENPDGGYIATAIYAIIILCTFLANKKIYTDENEKMMLFVTLVGALCYVARYFGTWSAERISFYFMFGQMIMLPNSFDELNSRDKNVAKLFAYILMVALFMYRLDKNPGFLPFSFCW